MRESTKKVILNTPGLTEYMMANNYGRNTPVDRNLIPFSNYHMVFSESVAEELYNLSIITEEKDSEFAFALVGKLINDNIVHISDIIKSNGAVQGRRVDYENDHSFLDYINKVALLQTKYTVLFICHTHPAVGKFYMNFSEGDLDGLIALSEDNSHFKIKDFGQGILTGDRQLFFAFYDPHLNKVFQFGSYSVYCKKKKELISFEKYMEQKGVRKKNR